MYLYSYPSTHSISGLAAGGPWEQFEVRLKMTIELTQRYTARQWSSEFSDALGEGNLVYLEIHFEAIMEQVWRCTSRPWLCKLGIRNHVSLEMHLHVIIERSWRYTWRPWSTELRDALRDHDQASLEMHLEAIIVRVWRYSSEVVIERDWKTAWRQLMDSAPGAETSFIS